MNECALLLLLREWHRQLEEGLEEVKGAFPDPEPERVRRWITDDRVSFGERISLCMAARPTEDDPPEKWEWIEVPHTPPMLLRLEATIARIGEQIVVLEEHADGG